MEEGRPSSTARGAAMLRAAHVLLDGEPKILTDNFAMGLSGVDSDVALQAALETMQADFAQRANPELARALLRHLRASVTMRSRYTEDELSEAITRGVRQYVILGAGLDSFAYRRRDLIEVVRIFEVDHPATQQWKRARLQELQIELPPNLTFIPIDFERQTLADALRTGVCHLEEPVFFSWLGVTGYLTEEAIFKTLREVATAAPGSEIVFGYGVREELLDRESQQMRTALKGQVAARGEPTLSLFDPTSLAARVKAVGFAQVWDFGPEAANA
ncbi:MAG: class I SAM-dependent methyltransferase, partial [Deltaproteobacteria bacterium]|nr:class I SAM-dependent methyltransferase [Deltaproteobacteria bacterium]